MFRHNCWIFILASIGLFTSCGEPVESQLAFDSHFSVLMQAHAANGFMITASDNEAQQQKDIVEQLRYAIGQLGNGRRAMIAHGRNLNVAVKQREAFLSPEGETLFRIRYSASFQVSWPRTAGHQQRPVSYSLYLPLRADDSGREGFAAAFGNACGGSESASSLWYYYNPYLEGCPARDEPALNQTSPAFTELALTLELSEDNTTGLAPPYERIWQDQRLDVLFFASNLTVPGAGRAGERLIEMMSQTYGFPGELVRDEFEDYNLITAHFHSSAGAIVIRVVDVTSGTIQNMDEELITYFSNTSALSDLIAYNGHAGLGRHIQRFTSITSFLSDRYYLYWINACRPFAYIDQTLPDAVSRQNPGDSPWKHLDIMASTGIGAFNYGSDIKRLIDHLVEKRASYREILASLPRGEPAVVGTFEN